MSKKANPTLIGVFVIGAIALAVISLIVLGAGKIFSERESYVTYFDGSIQGLREGANVTFRGVRIGQVRKVFVRFDESMLKFDLPVIIELEPSAILTMSGENISRDESGALLRSLIDRGLRAKLQMESFVTGQLLVDLDFYPDEPAILRGTNYDYIEIPTLPSDIQLALENVQKFMEKLRELPLEDILSNITSTMQGIEQLVNSPELHDSIKNIDQSFAGVNKLINSPETQNISASLQHSIKQLDATVSEINSFVQRIDRRVNPIADDISKTMEEIQIAVIDMQNIFKEVRESVKDDSIRYELNTTLSELRNAARSVRVFIEYLETHPEALIQGKPNTQ